VVDDEPEVIVEMDEVITNQEVEAETVPEDVSSDDVSAEKSEPEE
jgi:hypothetical protein